MSDINIGSIQLPLSSATKTFAILAKRGAGKTYTGGVMAEEFAENNIPFVVFDPIDVWWGLRLNKDGKSKGLPVVVFGLEHADIQLNRDMGRDIARAIVRDNVSCVISTFGLPKVAQRHLIAEFADELLNINNTPRHVFIEEAHEFVPQRVFGGLGTVFNAVSNLVVMGRNRGIGVTLLNQRAATINKDVLTQLDTLLAFRNISPQDRKALKEWVEAHAAEGDFDKFMDSLPTLPTGEGWIWSPEFLGVFERIKIRKRKTFHPDRETIGSKFVMPSFDSIDVQSFIEKFTSAQKKELIKIKHPIVAKTPMESINIIEPPKISQELITLRNEYESKLLQKDVEIRKRDALIENIKTLIGGSSGAQPIVSNSSNLSMWLEKLGRGGTSKILRFLAERSGLKYSRSQIGLAVGMSSNSGTFSNCLSVLRRNKLILEENKLVWINPDL